MSVQSTTRPLIQIAFCGMLCWGLACQPRTGPAPAAAGPETAGTNTSDSPPSEKTGNAPQWQLHDDAVKYVGREACAKCHAEISQSYDTHPMARSVFRAEDIPLVKKDEPDRFDPPGPCQYSVFRDEQGLWQSEEFMDSSGAVVYRDVVPVQFAVGSGQRGWSFLTDRGGLLTQGVATWYSTRNVWDLSPGYQPTGHRRFSRRISDGCVTCHAGRTNSIPGEPDRFGAPVFTELSIGCERCHGPGKDHVEFHESVATIERADPIVNPASLGFAGQLSVCYQCHLHGEERVVRTGRSEFDFRPGERISDVWVTFVTGSGIQADETTSAVSQVEQMHMSVCFTKSDQRMTCTSCHDPHLSPRAEARVEFYRSRCLSCHEKTDSACRVDREERIKKEPADSCINCHMPSLKASDVPHTAQTDHRIIRFRQAERNQEVRGIPSLFDPVLFPVPELEHRRARGLLLAKKAGTVNALTSAVPAIQLLTPLAGEGCTDVPVLDGLATCKDLMGDHAAARSLLQTAFKIAPRNESVLRGLVVNSQQRGDITESLRYLNMVERLYPDDGTVVFQKVRLLSQLGRNAEALEACRRSVSLMPNDVDVRTALIQLANSAGETDLAAEQQALVDRMKESLSANPGSESQEKSGDR